MSGRMDGHLMEQMEPGQRSLPFMRPNLDSTPALILPCSRKLGVLGNPFLTMK